MIARGPFNERLRLLSAPLPRIATTFPHRNVEKQMKVGDSGVQETAARWSRNVEATDVWIPYIGVTESETGCSVSPALNLQPGFAL
jgi:hypothetical protein